MMFIERDDCVNGYNKLSLMAPYTVSNWAINGNYRDFASGNDGTGSWISFVWNGPSTNAYIELTYSGGNCSGICDGSTGSFEVGDPVMPGVTVSASQTSFQYGTPVTFTASPTHGGSSPGYHWYLNNVFQSSGSTFQRSNLQNNDQVYVRMNSSVNCIVPYDDKSNTITVNVTYTINPPVVSNYTIPYNTTVTLQASGAGSGQVYRWYEASTAGSYVEGLSYPITTPLPNHKTFFVSIKGANGESGRVPQTVTLIVAPPAIPTISTNTCGPKILTRGTPPANVLWCWQGTNQNGEGLASDGTYSVAEANDQFFYIRAKASTANIWSSPVGVKVTANPVDIIVDQYSAPNSLVQATHSITLKPGFIVPSGNQFTARIAITSECNDVYNWSEQIAYDQNAQPLLKSRTYLTGSGDVMQSQSIDYLSGKVWASQPLYDNNYLPVASTMSAPILEHDFIYKNKFVANTAGQSYSSNDFDTPATLNNPGAVGSLPGSLGWYYSSNNNLEGRTPVTNYPYSRNYTPSGPNPTTSRSAGPGNHNRMGSGHEATSERQLIAANDLTHYLSLRSHFVTSLLPVTGYKIIITNPDGKKVVSFLDADGRGLASATLSGTTFDNWSYNYYNDLGQLVASVAPKGVIIGNPASPQFVTTYKYDHLGRLIQTTSPDEGTSKFVYSTDGKIRFSQNQEQFNANPRKFSYTNYDYLGRLVESGEYTSTTGGYLFEAQEAAPSDPLSVLHLIDINITRGKDIDDLNPGVSPTIFKGPSAQIDVNGRCSDFTYVKYDRQAATAPDIQENLEGQVSKTENENTVTFYSYDEFGQVIKTWQKTRNSAIVSPIVTVATSYTYDYFGNVTQVYYHRDNTSDKFYHHYVYDLNNRLIEAYTSKDGTTKTLQAKYEYYLHGPLKRVVFANNLQGIDYTYTIDGALKTINHADPAKDPGGDGTNDVFGETLHYYDGDYQGAGYSAGSQTISSADAVDQFGGMLKAMSWHSPAGNHQKQTYAYKYSDVNFLTNAKFGNMTGSGGSYTFSGSNNYQEAPGNYDKNGNIGTMTRTGKTANTLANYGYEYISGKNQLDKVNHNSTQMVDYTYNAIGQVTKQDEGASKNFDIVYNAYGLVEQVRKVVNSTSIVLQTYCYDDRGNLFQRILHDSNGVPKKRTTYFSDASGNVLAIYEQENSIVLASQPIERPVYAAGRVGIYKPDGDRYFYEVNDHLGNVRAVIGAPSSMTVTATLETANQATEQNQFLRYSNVRIVNAQIFNNTNGAGSQNSIRLSGSANEKTGLARSFSVSPGDVVKLEVYAKYVDNDRTNVSTVLNNLVNAIAAGTATPGTVIDGGAYATNSSNPFAYSGLLTPTSASGPKAFLNYLFFDRNFVFDVSKSGFVPVTEAAKENGTDVAHEKISAQLNITESGYVYAYLSNDNATPIEVYFDDFAVTHEQSAIVAGADYYPFGLAMENREITDEPYRYGYQGQFSEKDLTTEMQEFELRMYDARIGRWTTADPVRGAFNSPYIGMANQPHMRIDPDGGCPPPCPAFEVWGAAVEFASKGGTAAMTSSITSAVLTTVKAATWYAKDFGNFMTSSRVLNETRKGFLGATTLAASINYGYTGVETGWTGGYDDTALKFGQGASVLTSGYTMRPGGFSSGGNPVFATPNGNVPSLRPEVTIRAPTTVLGANGTINSEMSTSDPNSFKGKSLGEVKKWLLKNGWVSGGATNTGGGEKFTNGNFGEQVRLMPGYPKGSRPNAMKTDPYMVLSVGGKKFEIPLIGL